VNIRVSQGRRGDRCDVFDIDKGLEPVTGRQGEDVVDRAKETLTKVLVETRPAAGWSA